MDQSAPPSEPTPPAPAGPDALPCIAFLLNVVRTLLGFGRHLSQALPAQIAHPRFPTLAAGFGTHDARRILAHVQRGILRAMMLERYLLARAAQGRDIEPTTPPVPAEQPDIETLTLKLRPAAAPRSAPRRRADSDEALLFSMPTLRELETQIRRRSVGRTIADICLDLGVIAPTCDGAFWDEICQTLMHFGANLEQFFGVQTRRRDCFRAERDRRPETWDWDWRDRPRDAIRQMLGGLLGDPQPAAVPDSG